MLRFIPGLSRSLLPMLALLLPALPACALSDPVPLPDAPQPQQAASNGLTGPGRDNTFLGLHVGPAYPLEAGKYDAIINPGEHAQPLGPGEKLVYALHEQIQPTIFIPAIFSAGYGQLVDADPHYGTDSGGFGERFGGAMLRQATDRISGDGILPALFHQDARYYRSNGPIVQRGLHAVRQTFLRKNDHGRERISISGLGGHAIGNFLTMAYYPKVSASADTAVEGFATSVGADMGSKLIVEFGPDLLRLAFFRHQP